MSDKQAKEYEGRRETSEFYKQTSATYTNENPKSSMREAKHFIPFLAKTKQNIIVVFLTEFFSM